MPTSLRIVTWNIEKLSPAKVAIAGVPQVIGQVIVDLQADVVVILEVTQLGAAAVMTAVAAAANIASVAAGGNANNYTAWLTSYPTGGESYGLLIRDLDQIRPITIAPGGVPRGAGTTTSPSLTTLDEVTFQTWPNANFAVTAYPAPPLAALPNLPLTDVYATSPPLGTRRKLFGGQAINGGGYALGRGFRMPCLAMLNVRGVPANYLIPIVACHLGAVRGGANQLGRAQMQQFKLTHLAQMYTTPFNFANGGHLWIDGVAAAVTNIVFTGDFNVDFLQNAALGNAMQRGNFQAYRSLTTALPQTGAAAPPALGPVALPPAPALQPGPPYPLGPISNSVAPLGLKTAVTGSATMLRKYKAAVIPPNMAALPKSLFDNFFYGGSALSPNQMLLGPVPPVHAGQDAGTVLNLPAFIVNGAGPSAPNAYNVSGAWLHHMLPPPPPRRNAAAAPLLNPAAAVAPLLPNTALIGARFISDHLPILLGFTLP
ncbi:MAG TPA: hypothetical protein VI653_27825 [Steroidobacteraceae bacterium]